MKDPFHNAFSVPILGVKWTLCLVLWKVKAALQINAEFNFGQFVQGASLLSMLCQGLPYFGIALQDLAPTKDIYEDLSEAIFIEKKVI